MITIPLNKRPIEVIIWAFGNIFDVFKKKQNFFLFHTQMYFTVKCIFRLGFLNCIVHFF